MYQKRRGQTNNSSLSTGLTAAEVYKTPQHKSASLNSKPTQPPLVGGYHGADQYKMPKINKKSNMMTLKEFQNVGSSGGGGKYYVDKGEPLQLRKDEV